MSDQLMFTWWQQINGRWELLISPHEPKHWEGVRAFTKWDKPLLASQIIALQGGAPVWGLKPVEHCPLDAQEKP